MSKKKNHLKLGKISMGSNVAINIIFILLILLFTIPLILVVIVSFSAESCVSANGYQFIPEQLSTSAYQFAFKNWNIIAPAYTRSIFVTAVGSVASTFMIALYAYPLSRKGFKGRNAFAFIAFFTTIFGGGLVPWVFIYCNFLQIDYTMAILIVPYLLNAWWIIIMRTFMQTGIPEDLIEAARIDGANEFKIFIRIALPLCKAGIATIFLFNMLRYWNDYYLSLVFVKDSHLYTIQYYMYQLLSSVDYISSNSNLPAEARRDLPSETVRMAIAVIAVGPVVFTYPFFQQFFAKGLTIGAVKG